LAAAVALFRVGGRGGCPPAGGGGVVVRGGGGGGERGEGGGGGVIPIAIKKRWNGGVTKHVLLEDV